MLTKLTILGVHPVGADEACRLVEILVEGHDVEIDFGEITQGVKGSHGTIGKYPMTSKC